MYLRLSPHPVEVESDQIDYGFHAGMVSQYCFHEELRKQLL
jgi:hypothetical protein